MKEVRLTKLYYEDFHRRKGVLFEEVEAFEVYEATQTLLQNWPGCAIHAEIPPAVGTSEGLYYLKFNFNSAGKSKLRICFGVWTNSFGIVEIVALSCRTKQELSGGSLSGTQAWRKHMRTIGKARWSDYRKNKLQSWKIY